jgi:hypothetical protein
MKLTPSFDNALKAIWQRKSPTDFLRLGILYTQGNGTAQDDILAQYFIKKALDMGCEEAEEYLELGYESGIKDFGDEINTIIGVSNDLSQEMIAKLKVRIEKERMAGNFGNLARIRQNLLLFYPEYNQEKAISDILSEQSSTDADILFTLSTGDNRSEIYLELQDKLLRQLYAPITSNAQLYKAIIEANDTYLLGQDERELIQCITNLTSSYSKICKVHGIKAYEIYSLDSIELYPYISVCDLTMLRFQGFRALLSIKDVDSVIHQKIMECLDCDEKMLNICEDIKDQDLQLFYISFIELNIDIESLQISSLALLRAYRSNNLTPLAEHINDFVDRLNRADIENCLPCYTSEFLPPIDLSDIY